MNLQYLGLKSIKVKDGVEGAIVFIQEFSEDKDYARQIRLQDTLAKTGEATDGNNKDIKCNIYDMAGNAREWSTETNNNSVCCSFRGGVFSYTHTYTSCRQASYSDFNTDNNSFRPIIYI